MREDLQTTPVSSASSHVRGAWSSTQPGSSSAQIFHTGDIGSAFAALQVFLGEGCGFAAMSNMSSAVSNAAVGKMLLVLRSMHDQWGPMFGPQAAASIECVHAGPAVVEAAKGTVVFGRTHDGRILRRCRTSTGSWRDDGDFGPSRVDSGLAAAGSTDGLHLTVAARGLDKAYWAGRSDDGGATWRLPSRLNLGTFLTGPALCRAPGSAILYLAGIGEDHKMWVFRSHDGGTGWDGNQGGIGAGVFTSAPALATSSDGSVVHAVGRGNDLRYWYSLSSNFAENFRPHWVPIGKGVFCSSPAALCSFDGRVVHVVGRGMDNQLWWNTSTDRGETWMPHWRAIPGDMLLSAATLCSRSNGADIRVCALHRDFRVWTNRSTDRMITWEGWQPVGGPVLV